METDVVATLLFFFFCFAPGSATPMTAHLPPLQAAARLGAAPRSAVVCRATPPSRGGGGGDRGSADSPSPPPLPNPLADPAATVVWGGRLPSRRRLLTSAAAATAIVLGGNLGGVTSRALSASDAATAAARAARLDIILPVRGAKRCAPPGAGWEFTYPAAWLADRTVAERRAAAGERARSLDPPSLRNGGSATAARAPLPDAAFGPPDTAGETNVSVLVAPIAAGFTLAGSLGAPRDAGEKFLATVIAPPGSPRSATLISASQRTDARGTPYYLWEYRVLGPGFDRTNVSALAARRVLPSAGRLELVTLNAQAPTADFQADARLRAALRESAASLVVVDRVADGTGRRGM
jgi:hypothetical protein